jgi:hypothetical protein
MSLWVCVYYVFLGYFLHKYKICTQIFKSPQSMQMIMKIGSAQVLEVPVSVGMLAPGPPLLGRPGYFFSFGGILSVCFWRDFFVCFGG